MTILNKETIQKLTRLCRIDCTEEEQAALLTDLEKIIEHMELLQEVNTENVAPCHLVLEDVVNVFREDIVGTTLAREEFLANAPAHVDGMVRVPRVIT